MPPLMTATNFAGSASTLMSSRGLALSTTRSALHQPVSSLVRAGAWSPMHTQQQEQPLKLALPAADNAE